MAPVIVALATQPDRFESKVLTTGQHREMLVPVLKLFKIKPDFDLAVMTQGQTLNQIVSRVVDGMDAVFNQFRPDTVFVQGDTTSAFSAALAAFHHKIFICHIEAGLRTGDKFNPYPEEANRHLIGVLADLHFAPTNDAKENLLREGVSPSKIHVTGNTAIDALRMVFKRDYQFNDPLLRSIDFRRRRVITLTTHRRESFGAPMRDTFEALKILVNKFPDVEVIFPVHFNPNVRSAVRETIEGYDRVHLIDPLEYEAFVHLMGYSTLILTDSGGIQEEAPSLGRPVLVLRETTERPEGIAAGTSCLVGTCPERIVSEASRLLEDPIAYKAMAKIANPYGDGRAAEKIVEIIQKEVKV